MTQEEQNFVNTISMLAQEDMKRTGVPASLTIAQAILESGWGKSGLATDGKALFGIKATSKWQGKVYNAKTKECYDGVNMVTVDGSFRAYDSWEESIQNHGDLLSKSSRYKSVIGEMDYKKACEAVHKAGYATDPHYTQKLIDIIEQYNLNQYDSINISVNDNFTDQPPSTSGSPTASSNNDAVGAMIGVVESVGNTAGLVSGLNKAPENSNHNNNSAFNLNGGFGFNNTILVNPTDLTQKSQQIRQCKEQHQDVMNKMTNLILNIGEVWQGEAQMMFVSKYHGMQPIFDSFSKSLEEFAVLMKKVADEMEDVDRSGKNNITSIL